jgi:ABC-type nitrate/sulfonate/bicarbonate transport system substrate-binding protein
MHWKRWASMGLVVGLLVACAPAGGSPAGSAPASSSAGSTAAGRPATAAGAAPAGGASAAPSAPLEKINFALPSVSGVFVPHVLAVQKGFFREEGFEVEMPVMRSNLVTAAIASGEADYTGMFGPAVRDALSGIPGRVVGAVVDKSTRWFMAAPGTTSVEQLRGKAVAVSTIGSGPYNSGVLAFEHFGIDPHSEVTWYAAGTPAERLLAVQQGAAQASIFSGSEVPRAEALGLVRLLRLQDVVPLPESGITTSITKLESNRAQVKRALRAMVRALQYVKNDREGTLPVFMQFLSITKEEAEEAYDGSVSAYSDDGTVSERTVRFTIEAEKQQLKLSGDVPPSGVTNFGPLHEVLAELGITPAADAAR